VIQILNERSNHFRVPEVIQKETNGELLYVFHVHI